MDTLDMVTEYCDKCLGLKTWNAWYRPEEYEHICDDCRVGGIFGTLSSSQAIIVQRGIDKMVSDRVDDFKRRYVTLENSTHLIARSTPIWVLGSTIEMTLSELLKTPYKDKEVVMITTTHDARLAIKFKEERK